MFDLHMHTVWSDGKNTPEEMVQEAIRKGLETVGISDHSSGDPCGMKLEDSAAYKAEIARLKEKYAGQTRVLCGMERDFMTDDFTEYDYTIGSVHWLRMPDGHRISIRVSALKGEFGLNHAIIPGKTLNDLSKIEGISDVQFMMQDATTEM